MILWYLCRDAGDGDLPPLLYMIVVWLHGEGEGGHQDVKMQAGHKGWLWDKKISVEIGLFKNLSGI